MIGGSETTFPADAVIFNLEDTLTNSTAAVKAAWAKLAAEVEKDPAYVIAASRGRRVADGIALFKPHVRPRSRAMDEEVKAFEESALFFADAYHAHSPGSATPATLPTPPLSDGASSSLSSWSTSRRYRHRPSFVRRVSNRLGLLTSEGATFEDVFAEEIEVDDGSKNIVDRERRLEAWQAEAAMQDRSVRAVRGAKTLVGSVPEGRCAVTSMSSDTFARGCMERAGIAPPPVVVAVNDKQLRNDKPAPDAFLLAADALGFEARNCVVFEDSPAGIRAGLDSGATVVAVCSSHAREMIEACGAHFVVDTLEQVRIVSGGDSVKIVITK